MSSTANPQTNVDVTAYKNSMKTIIIVLNRNSSSISQIFIVRNGAVNTITSYVKSSSQNCIRGNDVHLSRGSFTAAMEALSMTTFVSNEIRRQM